MTDEKRVLIIEEDEVTFEAGDTKVRIVGVLSKKHAQLILLLVLAMVGMSYDDIMTAIGGA